MKRLVSSMLFVVLVLSLAVMASASDFAIDLPSVVADDIFNNIWNVEPIAQSATGAARFYVKVSSDTLYIWAEGILPDPYNNIYFDIDLDASTGYNGWQWPGMMGADMRVTNEEFFISTGTGWNWEKVAEVPHIRFDVEDKVAFMTAVPLDRFGEIDTLRIAFAGETVQMPARDKKTVEVDLF